MELENAPISEVVIGIQFNGVVLNSKCVYEYYQTIKDTFPIIEEHQVMPSVIENLEGPNETKILHGFNVRKFFINPQQNKFIQIQADRLLFNWRKTHDKLEYPHFNVVLKEFISIFKKLEKLSYIKEKFNSLEAQLNQLEVTYVDHIYIDDFNSSDFNTGSYLNILNINKKLKSLTLSTSYPVENLNGNITLDIKSATRNIDKKKLIVMQSTCRGGANTKIKMEKWLDGAHIELLNLFDSITTKEAKQKWGAK